MGPRLSSTQRACLLAASIAPLDKARTVYGRGRFQEKVVESLRKLGLMRINQVRKRHFQAVITDNGEAVICGDLATTRIPLREWPKSDPTDPGEPWCR